MQNLDSKAVRIKALPLDVAKGVAPQLALVHWQVAPLRTKDDPIGYYDIALGARQSRVLKYSIDVPFTAASKFDQLLEAEFKELKTALKPHPVEHLPVLQLSGSRCHDQVDRKQACVLKLDAPRTEQLATQLVFTGRVSRSTTPFATFTPLNPNVVHVSPTGLVTAVGVGKTKVSAEVNFAGHTIPATDMATFEVQAGAKGAGRPVAHIAGCTQDQLQVTCSGQGSFDPGGQELTYHWNLGDGREQSGKGLVTPTFRYPSPGDHEITVFVTAGRRSSKLSPPWRVHLSYGNQPPGAARRMPGRRARDHVPEQFDRSGQQHSAYRGVAAGQ